MKRVGVVGFSSQVFDEDVARDILTKALSKYQEPIMVVSGLTMLGIPKIAYEIASVMGWKTAGYACSDAENYECFPVDEKHIVGENWGDESDAFLAGIDEMIKVGGGPQSEREFASFEGPKVEFGLDAIS